MSLIIGRDSNNRLSFAKTLIVSDLLTNVCVIIFVHLIRADCGLLQQDAWQTKFNNTVPDKLAQQLFSSPTPRSARCVCHLSAVCRPDLQPAAAVDVRTREAVQVLTVCLWGGRRLLPADRRLAACHLRVPRHRRICRAICRHARREMPTLSRDLQGRLRC